MLFMCWTRETGVIPAALAGLLLAVKGLGHVHCCSHDHPDPGANHKVVGGETKSVGTPVKGGMLVANARLGGSFAGRI
jgi:hypothetical protein